MNKSMDVHFMDSFFGVEYFSSQAIDHAGKEEIFIQEKEKSNRQEESM